MMQQHILPSPTHSESVWSASSESSHLSSSLGSSVMIVESSPHQPDSPSNAISNNSILPPATDNGPQHVEAALIEHLSSLKAFLSAEFATLSSAVQQLQQDQQDTKQTLVSTTQRLQQNLDSLQLTIESSHSAQKKGDEFKHSAISTAAPAIPYCSPFPQTPFTSRNVPSFPPFAVEQRCILSASPRPHPSAPFATPSSPKTSTLDNEMARYAFKSYRPRSAMNDYFSGSLPNEAPTIYTWSPPMSAKHAGEEDIHTSSTEVESPAPVRVYRALDPNAGHFPQFVLGDGDDMRKSTDALFEMCSDAGLSPARMASPSHLIPTLPYPLSSIDREAEDHLRSIVPTLTQNYDVQCTIYGSGEKPILEEKEADLADAMGMQDDVRVDTPPVLNIGTPEPFSFSPILFPAATHELSMSCADPGYHRIHEDDDDAVEEELRSRLSSLTMRQEETPREEPERQTLSRSPVFASSTQFGVSGRSPGSAVSSSLMRSPTVSRSSRRSRSRSPRGLPYAHDEEYTGPIIYQSGGSRASSPVTCEDEAQSLRSRSRSPVSFFSPSYTRGPYYLQRTHSISHSRSPSPSPVPTRTRRGGSPIPYITDSRSTASAFGTSDVRTDRSPTPPGRNVFFGDASTRSSSPVSTQNCFSDETPGGTDVGEPVLENAYYTGVAVAGVGNNDDGDDTRGELDHNGEAARPESVTMFENRPSSSSAQSSPSVCGYFPSPRIYDYLPSPHLTTTNPTNIVIPPILGSSSANSTPVIPFSPIHTTLSSTTATPVYDRSSTPTMATSAYVPTYGGVPLDAPSPMSIGLIHTPVQTSPTRLQRPRFPTDRSPTSTAVRSEYTTSPTGSSAITYTSPRPMISPTNSLGLHDDAAYPEQTTMTLSQAGDAALRMQRLENLVEMLQTKILGLTDELSSMKSASPTSPRGMQHSYTSVPQSSPPSSSIQTVSPPPFVPFSPPFPMHHQPYQVPAYSDHSSTITVSMPDHHSPQPPSVPLQLPQSLAQLRAYSAYSNAGSPEASSPARSLVRPLSTITEQTERTEVSGSTRMSSFVAGSVPSLISSRFPYPKSPSTPVIPSLVGVDVDAAEAKVSRQRVLHQERDAGAVISTPPPPAGITYGNGLSYEDAYVGGQSPTPKKLSPRRKVGESKVNKVQTPPSILKRVVIASPPPAPVVLDLESDLEHRTAIVIPHVPSPIRRPSPIIPPEPSPSSPVVSDAPSKPGKMARPRRTRRRHSSVNLVGSEPTSAPFPYQHEVLVIPQTPQSHNRPQAFRNAYAPPPVVPQLNPVVPSSHPFMRTTSFDMSSSQSAIPNSLAGVGYTQSPMNSVQRSRPAPASTRPLNVSSGTLKRRHSTPLQAYQTAPQPFTLPTIPSYPSYESFLPPPTTGPIPARAPSSDTRNDRRRRMSRATVQNGTTPPISVQMPNLKSYNQPTFPPIISGGSHHLYSPAYPSSSNSTARAPYMYGRVRA